MSIPNQEIIEVDEKIWNEWLQKSKLHGHQPAQTMKIASGVVLSLASVGAAVFFLMK